MLVSGSEGVLVCWTAITKDHRLAYTREPDSLSSGGWKPKLKVSAWSSSWLVVGCLLAVSSYGSERDRELFGVSLPGH